MSNLKICNLPLMHKFPNSVDLPFLREVPEGGRVYYYRNPSATLVPLKRGHLSSSRLFTFNQVYL
jgi:hypothetical protein